MEWHSLWAFLFFVPLVFVIVWNYLQRKKKYSSFQFSSLKIIRSVSPGLKVRIIGLPKVLKVVALGFAIVALARPQKADTKIKRNVEGIDIVVTLDISDSMLIEDMKPENRLEASKKIIREFIQKRNSDRIGLVVFSGESYTRVPMTLDYPLLLKSLREVTTSRSIKMGTAIGVALANAVGRLKDSVAKSRVVIFLTDGENNSGTIDPLTALDIAKGYGVKIYSIGMGKDGQASLPVIMEDGLGRKVKKYRPIHSKINEQLLGQMAQETGGKYYRATTSNALKNVFEDINKLEKTKIESNSYTKYTELFKSYLFIAVVLYIISLLLSATVLRKGL
ncbi:MAG: VWA domain-containing protein [Bdellovibrionales bacterium]|nr:VWA domain-containing protein [Bdellovibrionales bacterium]